MIGEKVADLLRDKDTVKPIREYFKHLLQIKHKRMVEDEEKSVEHPGEEEEQHQVPGRAGKKVVTSKKGKKK